MGDTTADGSMSRDAKINIYCFLATMTNWLQHQLQQLQHHPFLEIGFL